MIQVSPQIAVTLVLAMLGCVFAFGKILLAQFEARIADRLKAIDKSNEKEAHAAAERHAAMKEAAECDRTAVAALRAEQQQLSQSLPLQYVRREDWIRFSSSIDHKQDRLNELVMEVKLEVTRARN